MREIGSTSDASHGGAALFLVGDCLFLTVVSCAATVVMHMMHNVGWGFVPECVSGMVLAMLLAMLMAFAVTPFLGSIESMVPSMVVAMISPMAVCVLHLLGWKLGMPGVLVLGGAFGVGMFVFVQVYGVSCRRTLQRDM